MSSRSFSACALAALCLLSALPFAVHAEGEEDYVPAVLDVTGWDDQTTEAAAGVVVSPVPDRATGIGPGSYLLMDRPDGSFICTASYIFSASTTRYLAAAGHCFVPASKTATHGNGSDYNPSGTTVRVCIANCTFGGQLGAIIRGTMVTLGPVAYARQASPTGAELGNDFGIVTIPTARHSLIRTAIPVWGPVGGTANVNTLGTAVLFGNGGGVGEVYFTQARAGAATGGGASLGFFSAQLPSAPGDSGSAVALGRQGAAGLTADKALGTLTHISASMNGAIVGTTIAKGMTMASEAGLTITPVY